MFNIILDLLTLHRYITRSVLIPFIEGQFDDNAVSRMAIDQALNEAIENVPKATSLVIALIVASGTKELLENIIGKIQTYLKSAPQRLYISYGWLLLCTFLV